MPLPLILGIAAGVAGLVGVGNGIIAAGEMSSAKDWMKEAKELHRESQKKFREADETTTQSMDALGVKELEVMKSFESYSDLVSKIGNRPVFKGITHGNVKIPSISMEEIKSVYVGAGTVLGSLGAASMGVAGGVAASGALSTVVSSTLSYGGIAAANHTLAVLGGGSLAAGGGGMALGAAVLSGATLGAGMLVGGLVLNKIGTKMSDDALDALEEAEEEERNVNEICKYLYELKNNADEYLSALSKVKKEYDSYLNRLNVIITVEGKNDYSQFSSEDKIIFENVYYIVAILYQMCKVQLVIKSEDESKPNKVNTEAVKKSISDADDILKKVA